MQTAHSKVNYIPFYNFSFDSTSYDVETRAVKKIELVDLPLNNGGTIPTVFMSLFIAHGSNKEIINTQSMMENIDLSDTDSFQTMLASEAVLSRDWDQPEEDEAWAYLQEAI